MITQLPKWVEVGAFILALVAGFINAIGLLSFEHQSVAHLSGTATLLGTSFLGASFLNTIHLVGILFSFLLGSILSGILLHGSSLKLGKHYDTALFIEALLLLISLLFLTVGSFFGHYFASAACGLQNAMATTYSGAIIRTTHVTGIFTDLGIMIGELIKGHPLDRRKAQLFILIICGFICGATIGALLYAKYQFLALLFPALGCLIIAAVYRVYVEKHS